MADGIKWGEDLERDCAELRKLESWGLYRTGYHAENCPLEHDKIESPTERGPK